ncbi:hypothetical protein AAG906_031617 [Vitis piasezkii]
MANLFLCCDDTVLSPSPVEEYRGRGSRIRSWALKIWTLLQQMPDTTDGNQCTTNLIISSGVGYDWKKLPSAQ